MNVNRRLRARGEEEAIGGNVSKQRTEIGKGSVIILLLENIMKACSKTKPKPIYIISCFLVHGPTNLSF